MVTAQRFGSQLCFHLQVQTYLEGPFERVAFGTCVSEIVIVQGGHHIGLHVRTDRDGFRNFCSNYVTLYIT